MRETSKASYGATIVAGVAALVLSSSCAVLGDDGESETVVIGVELSGEDRELSEIHRNALQLRVEQINEEQLLGDRQLELRVMDIRSDSAAAISSLNELAADPSVAAIISGQCGECLVAVAEDVAANGVPAVSLAFADDVAEPVSERSHIFKIGPNASHNAQALVADLRRAEVATVALVTSDDSYGENGQSAFADSAERAGLEIVVNERVTGDDESGEVATVAEEILEWQASEQDPGQPNFTPPGQEPGGDTLGPDAVVAWAPGAVASDLALALREAEYEGGFYLDASAADELFLPGPRGEALTGARMVFTETLVIDELIATSSIKAARKAWFRDYVARQGTYHAHASFAADAVGVLVEAIARFDTAERDSIHTALRTLEVEALSGPIRITPENHSGLMPQAMTTLTVRGGRWHLAS